jgi:hypothetical protein
VNETLRYALPEVAIALTMFREELSLRIWGLFAILLFAKVRGAMWRVSLRGRPL